MILDGAVERFAATLCLVGSTLANGLAMRGYVVHVKSELMHGVIVERMLSRSSAASVRMR